MQLDREKEAAAACEESTAQSSPLLALQARGWELALESSPEACAHWTAVRGTLRNQTGAHCGYLQIEFDLLDAAGELLGRAIDLTQNLAAGDEWRFCARAVQERAGQVAVCRFAKLTAAQ